jgi:hypothetical protein
MMSDEILSGEILCEELVSDCAAAAHSARVIGYTVDFPGRELRIHAERDDARVELCFAGLLAHQFDHAVRDNIIYDVTLMPMERFLKEERKRLVKALRYGFPAPAGHSIETLRRKLREKDYRVYEIRASVGLCGFVIAKSLKVNTAVFE